MGLQKSQFPLLFGELGTIWKYTGHILDLYCVRLSNATPFCENYAKVYFDAKRLEKGLKFLVPFLKNVPFLVNIECCPKFLEYHWTL